VPAGLCRVLCVTLTACVAAAIAAPGAAWAVRDTATSGAGKKPRIGHRARGDTMYVVAPIVIAAPRIDPRLEQTNTPGFVTAIDLSSRRTRVEDLASVLAPLAGVHIREYGGLGDFATISIRGSSANQVAVYLDGVPVADPYSAISNLSDLPLGGIERIEVFRGYSPTRFGASALGGAINLVSHLSPDGTNSAPATGGEFTASYGSFDTSRQRITARARRSFLATRLHVSHEYSRGGFSFFDNNGTAENTGDDAISTRTNNDHELWNTLLRMNATATQVGRFTAGIDWFTHAHGVPGLGVNQSTTARSERSRTVAQIAFAGNAWWHLLRADARAYTSRFGDRFRDPNADIALTGTDTDNRFAGGGGRVHLRVFPPRTPFVFDTVLDIRRERFVPHDNLPVPADGPPRWRHARTAAITGELHLADDALLVTVTQRYEHTTSEYQEPPRFPWLPPVTAGRAETDERTPSVGVRWRALAWLTAKGSLGRYQRLPGFLEMFGNAGSVTGNPKLEPETGTNRDVGVVLTADRMGSLRNAFLEVVYVSTNTENLILFFPNSQFTSRPVNIGASRVRAVETSASAALTGHVHASFSWTHMKTRDTSAIAYYHGNELPSRPRNEISASLRVPWHRWTLAYEYHRTGANWIDRANLQRTDTRELHNVAATVSLPAGISVTMEGKNLTNNRIGDVAGFPLPGRSFFATIRYSIHQ